jgi:hypothetical protein
VYERGEQPQQSAATTKLERIYWNIYSQAALQLEHLLEKPSISPGQ